MGEVDDETLLLHVDCLAGCVGACDDGASIGVVRIDKILLAVID